MLTPDQFADAPVYDLLIAASEGKIGIDQRWAAAIQSRGESAMPDIVRFGEEDHSEDPVGIDDELMIIVRELRSPSAVPFFVGYLRSNTDYVPDTIIGAMFPLREALLEPLIQLYGELEEDNSGEVAFALAAFRIHDGRVLKILLDRLEYDVEDGAICLGLYGDPAAKPALEKMLAEVEDDHLRSNLRDAIDQLGREADMTEVPPDLNQILPEKALPDTAVLDEPDLLEMLRSPDKEYQVAAAAAFINRDLSEEAIRQLLDRARTDADDAVRAKCWEALGGEAANAEVYSAMLSRLEDKSVPLVERAGALVGLGQRANEEPVRSYAIEFYGNAETRAAALAAMWNSLDRSFAKYFPIHLEDPDPDIRKQAISGIGYLGIHESAEKLRQFFDDEDYRENALFSYALSVRAEISPGRVRPLLRRIEQAGGGLTFDETELVEVALDTRLMLHGHKPVFHLEHGDDEEGDGDESNEPEKPMPKVGRNDLCPCGSGKKYKKCHGS